MMPMMESVIAVVPHCEQPNGSTGNNQRRTPKIPIFSMIDESIIVPCDGAVVYVSGCQVCKGKMGILMANARKINQNNIPCVSGARLSRMKSANSQEPLGVLK